ncbi:LysM peptidoglycan-binding domain-containing protein [Chlorogloeopsis fritschii PCC 9212]|uniref:LysM domain-containing protein n=1 Tax=Chlorogloeopsis fritschii PCC 6912 TaxID=211165 RepID=A0A3S1A934_CHLFR|nr:LysM peptidoglycan-binding domain-containing protein [Chlorogloeopsis fritschii]RUR72735.1 hypothetical protein PCC6912_61100 [Chlorogloeopsis fritschii PCC 6912]
MSRRYTVQPGDTLWEIAARFYGDGSQYDRIAQANGIADPDRINIGQQLIIPDSGSYEHRTYTVQPGDTLWEIAARFYGDGSQYDRIVQANGIADPDRINIGQQLIIPS